MNARDRNAGGIGCEDALLGYVRFDLAKHLNLKIEILGHGLDDEIGARNAIGRIDLVENRFVGIKSRGLYETPGGTLITTAHRELEALTLDCEVMHYKQQVALKYAELVYFGLWFTPLREALDAFVDNTQKLVTGSVSLSLYKGNISVAKRHSPYSLYSDDLSSFTMGDSYDQKDAKGFIQILGLPARTRARLLQKKEAVQ